MKDRLSTLSLATAITVSIVASVLLGAVLVGGTLWGHSRSVGTGLSEQVLAAAAEQVGVVVGAQLDEAERVLAVNVALLRDLTELRAPLSSSLRTLVAHCQSHPYITVVYLARGDGDYAGVRRWPDGRLTVSIGTWGEEETISRYTWLAEEQRPGGLVATVAYDPPTRSWYQQAVAAGAPIWTRPYRDAFNDQIGLTTAAPVLDSAGNLLGVVAVDLHFPELHKLLQEQVIAPGGQVLVLDQEGHYLVSSGEDHGEEAAAAVSARSAPPALLLAAYEAACGGEAVTPDGCRFELAEGGRNLLGHAVLARSGGGLAWRVLATAPADHFLRPVRRGERLAALLAVLGALLAALLGWALSRRIARPIATLTARAARLGLEDPPPGPIPEGFREVRQLGQSLWEIHRHLRQTLRSLAEERDLLEHRVEERTRELAVANARLERLAAQDGLTSIANRRRFDEFLAQEWHRAVRTHRPLTLMLCDIDFFKRYNDTFGHLGGDDCLRQVAMAIEGCVRVTDLAARFGGEEFAILLPETGLERAQAVAERIRAAVMELDLPHPAGVARTEGGLPVVTVSLGLASGPTAALTDTAALIAAADRALYRAKQEGRNRVLLTLPPEPDPPTTVVM